MKELALKRRSKSAEESGGSKSPGETMARSADKRRNYRIRARFEISYSTERQEGPAILANISYSGALLTQASLQPRLESQVRIYVLLNEDFPFVVVGKVVRHVEGGFAIEYADLSPEVRRLVDYAAALVGNALYVPPGRQPLS